MPPEVAKQVGGKTAPSHKPPTLHWGDKHAITAKGSGSPLMMPAHHLTTHGCIVGMTGSGKTGLVFIAVEEALRNRVPVLMIDVKGDLPNLLLSFPDLEPHHLVPWVEGTKAPGDLRNPEELAQAIATERKNALTSWGIGNTELQAFHAGRSVRLITPGSTAGEGLHVLSALERPSKRWQTDPEAAQAGLTATISLMLRLVGRDADPARSREHVYLSLCAERRLRVGLPAGLAALIADLETPPFEQVGALDVNKFLSNKERALIAASLNSLLASPSFSTWREGASLELDTWLTPDPTNIDPIGLVPKTPAVIVSVAHLDDEERTLVLGVLLEELLTWVRSLPGSRGLRALIVFDEVYGFLPPHPNNPPTKRPLVQLMKQARAFGVGVLIATQNPMDLDYRALSNAGVWALGTLQTDADRERVIEGLASGDRKADQVLDRTVQQLAKRWFVLRDMHAGPAPVLLQPRYAMTYMRGPMTRSELMRAAGAVEVTFRLRQDRTMQT
jgi:hypothetical protein